MELRRAAWIATTILCLAAAALALWEGFRGYAAVAFAIAVAAAINVR